MKHKCSVSFPHWIGLQLFLSNLSESITNLVSHLFFSFRWRCEHGNYLTFLSAWEENSFMKVVMSGTKSCLLSGRHYEGKKLLLGSSVSQDSALSNSHVQKSWTHHVLLLPNLGDIRNPEELVQFPGFKYQQRIQTFLTRKKFAYILIILIFLSIYFWALSFLIQSS